MQDLHAKDEGADVKDEKIKRKASDDVDVWVAEREVIRAAIDWHNGGNPEARVNLLNAVKTLLEARKP